MRSVSAGSADSAAGANDSLLRRFGATCALPSAMLHTVIMQFKRTSPAMLHSLTEAQLLRLFKQCSLDDALELAQNPEAAIARAEPLPSRLLCLVSLMQGGIRERSLMICIAGGCTLKCSLHWLPPVFMCPVSRLLSRHGLSGSRCRSRIPAASSLG